LRISERDSLLREALVANGLPEGDLDAALTRLKAKPSESSTSADTPAARAASLNGLAGGTATFEGKTPETAEDWIRAGLEQAKRNNK
jgi:hypothetical protein